jgi:hypothetical protein
MAAAAYLALVSIFGGVLLFMQGYYSLQLKDARENNKRVEYRFVPRTFYEDQFFGETPTSLFRDMFQSASPWPGDDLSGGAKTTKKQA